MCSFLRNKMVSVNTLHETYLNLYSFCFKRCLDADFSPAVCIASKICLPIP